MDQHIINAEASMAAVQTSSRPFSESFFITIVFAVILTLTLTEHWTTFLNNLGYRTIGLNRNSTMDTFIYALVLTVVFFAIMWLLDKYKFIVGNVESALIGVEARGVSDQLLS